VKRRRMLRSSSERTVEGSASFWGSIRLMLIITLCLLWISLDMLFYRLSTLGSSGYRYAFIPLVVVAFLIWRGVVYIKTIYGLRTSDSAREYLFAELFGWQYPAVTVSDGHPQVKQDADNLVIDLGGPGYVVVQPGNAALVENLNGGVRVLAPGRHFISRYEIFKEAISLEERNARIEKITATAKDGIEVNARDIRYRYRLMSDPQAAAVRQTGSFYPFSQQAVIDMVYNRNMSANGVAGWHQGVNQGVETPISDFIRTHPVDYLTAPNVEGRDARQELYNQFLSEGGRNQFKMRGAELLWIDIGHFEVPEKSVIEQRMSTWQAKWIGSANVVRAYGESKRIAYQELGRAEAQADMLLSIVHALDETGMQGDPQQTRRALYLARIAQLLETMSSQALLPGHTPPEK
jgi:hypothetical protein